MESKRLIVILADISGYTRFMLESRTAALHGQIVINGLIEALLREVDIPLTLQEIEGDAVFLYAAHPGSEAEWLSVTEQVSRKLMRFFDAFIAQSGVMIELTPCPCPICVHADQLGLKIVVHAGEAVFHSIAGRPQVSGPDVILAHRLLKNSVAVNEYLLLTEAAFETMGRFLPDGFSQSIERYEGFGDVAVRVRPLDGQMLAARDAVYSMSRDGLNAAVDAYVGVVRSPSAAMPRPGASSAVSPWLNRLLWWWDRRMVSAPRLRRIVTARVLARGHRKPPSMAAG